MKIKIYYLETVLLFGRFKNKTIKEIVDIDPTYITWCIGHLDHFLISEEVVNGIYEKYPIFELSDNIKAIIDEKEKAWQNHNYYDSEYEDYSNDFINDALDGFGDAYWNID